MLPANRSDTDENSNVIPAVTVGNGTNTNTMENFETVTANQPEKGLEDTGQADENKTEENKNKDEATKVDEKERNIATTRPNEVLYSYWETRNSPISACRKTVYRGSIP